MKKRAHNPIVLNVGNDGGKVAVDTNLDQVGYREVVESLPPYLLAAYLGVKKFRLEGIEKSKARWGSRQEKT